jgi:hypothetical protein
VLDVIEHRLKPTDCGFVRLCSEDTLALTPDDSTAKSLCVCVANTLENSVLQLLFAVFEEVEATAVVCSVKIVFDAIWVV